MPSYELQYRIIEALEDEPSAIAPVELYDVDPEKMLIDGLVRLSQPTEDGTPSPFSSRNILSGEAILLGNLLEQLQYFGHELNLFPDNLFLTFFRLLGLSAKQATDAQVKLEFSVSPEAIDRLGTDLVAVERGTSIPSKFVPGRNAIVVERATLPLGSSSIEVAALVKRDSYPIRAGEFSLLPVALSGDFTSVINTQIIDRGNDPETIEQTIARARTMITRPGNRVVTARDYVEVAKSAGASSAVALPYIKVDEFGVTSQAARNSVTVAVYPPDIKDAVFHQLEPLVPIGTRLAVVPGRIVPIGGRLRIGIDPSLSTDAAFDLVATAIVDQINPPNARWGARDFPSALAVALERVRGIYSVAIEYLEHTVTKARWEELSIAPTDLFEIQDSIEIEWLV